MSLMRKIDDTRCRSAMARIVAVTCLVFVTAACDSQPTATPSQDAGATAQPQESDAVTVRMGQYIELANEANVEDQTTLVHAAARPTVLYQESSQQTMVIRDEDESSWGPGNYRLVVYCVGEGVLYAHLGIGGRSKVEELPPCSDDITTGVVDLHIPEEVSGLTVIIIPVGPVEAAISYQLQLQ